MLAKGYLHSKTACTVSICWHCCYNKSQDIRTSLIQYKKVFGWQYVKWLVVVAPDRSHYRILVSRANLRPQAELYAFNLREAIPQFLLPLQSGDEEPVVNLSEVLGDVYREAALDLAIDYSV